MLACGWKSASLTHAGNVRKLNEDSNLDAPQCGLWVVADGMGGHFAGDVASQLIVSSLSVLPRETTTLSKKAQWIDDALGVVNAQLLLIAEKEGGRRIVGSTVVALVAVDEGLGICAWAGDSRLYRLRGAVFEQISQDHSQVEEMIMRGELLRENAEKHPSSNVITRAVGAHDKFFVDMEWIEMHSGDRYLLCSDGLYKELEDHVIGSILAHRLSAEVACRELLESALLGACKDNVSVVVVDV